MSDIKSRPQGKRLVDDSPQDSTIQEPLKKQVKTQNDGSGYPDFLINLPTEIIDIIIKKGNLQRQDIINLSELSSKHRIKFFDLVYQSIKLTWSQFKTFHETMKHKSLIKSIRVFSDFNDTKATNYGEWNISMKDLLSDCNDLNELVIEVLTSARSLKYQDKFDVDLSNKITNIRLITHADEVGDQSLFELTQLQKFHNIKKLALNGFLVSKDQLFYPKYKSDFSDWKIRSKDGKLLELDDLKLINCKWEHPLSLSDIFSPIYPTPNSLTTSQDQFTAPSSISLFYSQECSSFVVSERFKSLIDNDQDEMFMFQTRFYTNLKKLSLIILNKDYEENKYKYYYPWLNLLNIRRKFPIQNKHTDEIETISILNQLESLELVGWRLSNVQELEKCFVTDLNYNMKHISLYISRSGEYSEEISESDKHFQKIVEDKLNEIFNKPGKNSNRCVVEVGFIEECFNDGRYDSEFSKLEK